jgi:hypothetical protein
MPAWRVCGAVLAACAIGLQLLVSGLLIGRGAVAMDQAELSVVCSHDPAALNGLDDGTGTPTGPASHEQCPACAFPPSAKLFASAPASPSFALPHPRSEVPRVFADHIPAEPYAHSPYASRAPPRSA